MRRGESQVRVRVVLRPSSEQNLGPFPAGICVKTRGCIVHVLRLGFLGRALMVGAARLGTSQAGTQVLRGGLLVLEPGTRSGHIDTHR